MLDTHWSASEDGLRSVADDDLRREDDDEIVVPQRIAINKKLIIIGSVIGSCTILAIIVICIYIFTTLFVSQNQNIPRPNVSRVYQMSGFIGSNTSNYPNIFIANGPNYGSWLQLEAGGCVAANPEWLITYAECCLDSQGLVYVLPGVSTYDFIPVSPEGDHILHGCSSAAFYRNNSGYTAMYYCCQGCSPGIYGEYAIADEVSTTGPFKCT
jgi:hypothetical protein